MTANSKSNLTIHDLPDVPLAGARVSNELAAICTDKTCLNLNDWLNELYFFKTRIQNIQEGAMKYFDQIIKIIGNLAKLKNILVLVILTRLLFLEHNQLALIAEIVGSIAVLLNPLSQSDIIDE